MLSRARTALSMDPKNAEAYRNVGLAPQATEQYTAAAHAFSESLARDPDNPDTYYDLGSALEGRGKDVGRRGRLPPRQSFADGVRVSTQKEGMGAPVNVLARFARREPSLRQIVRTRRD